MRSRTRGITPMELEVVRLVVEGLSNDEIAARLVKSPNTVKSHIRIALERLGLNSRLELVLWALGHRLVEIPEHFR